jgi:hypothetical protein
MSTEDLDYDGWPTSRGFARTASQAFKDAEYGAAIERPAQRARFDFVDAICWVLGVAMLLVLFAAREWWY